MLNLFGFFTQTAIEPPNYNAIYHSIAVAQLSTTESVYPLESNTTSDSNFQTEDNRTTQEILNDMARGFEQKNMNIGFVIGQCLHNTAQNIISTEKITDEKPNANDSLPYVYNTLSLRYAKQRYWYQANPLTEAIIHGDEAAYEILSNQFDTEEADYAGLTPLERAIAVNNYPITKRLVDDGAIVQNEMIPKIMDIALAHTDYKLASKLAEYDPTLITQEKYITLAIDSFDNNFYDKLMRLDLPTKIIMNARNFYNKKVMERFFESFSQTDKTLAYKIFDLIIYIPVSHIHQFCELSISRKDGLLLNKILERSPLSVSSEIHQALNTASDDNDLSTITWILNNITFEISKNIRRKISIMQHDDPNIMRLINYPTDLYNKSKAELKFIQACTDQNYAFAKKLLPLINLDQVVFYEDIEATPYQAAMTSSTDIKKMVREFVRQHAPPVIHGPKNKNPYTQQFEDCMQELLNEQKNIRFKPIERDGLTHHIPVINGKEYPLDEIIKNMDWTQVSFTPAQKDTCLEQLPNEFKLDGKRKKELISSFLLDNPMAHPLDYLIIQDFTGAGFMRMNALLRGKLSSAWSESSDKINKLKITWLKNAFLAAATNAIPLEDQDLFACRGMSTEPNQKLTPSAFMSTSIELSICKRFSLGGTIIIFESNQGKNIISYSSHVHENEYLLSPSELKNLVYYSLDENNYAILHNAPERILDHTKHIYELEGTQPELQNERQIFAPSQSPQKNHQQNHDTTIKDEERPSHASKGKLK